MFFGIDCYCMEYNYAVALIYINGDVNLYRMIISVIFCTEMMMYKCVLFANINNEQVLLNGYLIKSGLNISFLE